MARDLNKTDLEKEHPGIVKCADSTGPCSERTVKYSKMNVRCLDRAVTCTDTKAARVETTLPADIVRSLVEALMMIKESDLGVINVEGEPIKGFSEADLEVLKKHLSDAIDRVNKDFYLMRLPALSTAPNYYRIKEERDRLWDSLQMLETLNRQVLDRLKSLKVETTDSLTEDFHDRLIQVELPLEKVNDK